MIGEPAVVVRKSGRTWRWWCTNGNCGRGGRNLGSQPAALTEACRHLVDKFDEHHDMAEVRPVWNETEARYTATCHCGHEAEEKTENGAEESIYAHREWLRAELPAPTREEPLCA